MRERSVNRARRTDADRQPERSTRPRSKPHARLFSRPHPRHRTAGAARSDGAEPSRTVDRSGVPERRFDRPRRTDDNFNEVLDEPEIELRTPACSPAPDPVLVRLEPVPPSDTCREGGTEVLSGADLNADGVLSDDEISQRNTLCREQLLTRHSTIAAGPECAATGVRIETGRDRDEDGLLDDAEVEVTSVECSRVYVGSLNVTSQAQADALVDVALVDGDLTIAPTEDAAIALPNLRAVLGFVWITGTAVGSVDLSSLAEVSSELSIRDTTLLTSLSASPSLPGWEGGLGHEQRRTQGARSRWLRSIAGTLDPVQCGAGRNPVSSLSGRRWAWRSPTTSVLGTLSLDSDGDLDVVRIRNNPKLFSLRFHAPLSWVTSVFALENCASLEQTVIQQTIRPSATLEDFPRLLGPSSCRRDSLAA